MNKSILLSLLTLILAACGDGSNASVEDVIAGGNLEEIKAKQQVLNKQQREIATSLRRLDSAIQSSETLRNVPLVSTLELKNATFEHYLDLQGNVQTKQNILLYPEMAGTLVKVYVKEGQSVRKGQILAKIDDGGMSSGLEQLRTQASLAETTYERQKRLWEQNIGSEIQYLQTKTNFEATVQAVRQAEAQLAKSTITAPFSGIVDDVLVDEGSTVNPAGGTPIIRLVNLSDMYVEVDVPESYLREVTEGKRVELYIPVLGDSMVSKVRQTGNFINPANRTFKVEVSVPNTKGQIKPNLTVRVKINDYSNSEAILVPPGVISENSAGEQYVYVATDIGDDKLAKAEKRVIRTGLSQNNSIEVLSGIEAGEFIILEGARRVREGQKIEIIEQI